MWISVKDNHHISGITTTIGSRSYIDLYGAQGRSSSLVQNLADLGAIVVGKTKMGAYASSEVPPEKTIDYFAPWNPRGDGYQGPSGSSSGAGSSLASYPWLDFAFGTDSAKPYIPITIQLTFFQLPGAYECLQHLMVSGVSVALGVRGLSTEW